MKISYRYNPNVYIYIPSFIIVPLKQTLDFIVWQQITHGS